MKKICFAIPTWNRAPKLERCIENIAQQILADDIDAGIYVSDNASDDDTAAVVKKLVKKYPFTSHVRQKENIGWLPNIAHVLSHAEGSYIWLMGDDDLVLPGGVKLLADQLNDDELALVQVGNGWFKPHSGNVYQGTLIDFANKMGFNQFIGWISADIIRQDIARKMVSIPEWAEYEKNAFPHVCALLHVAAYEKAKVIDVPIANPMEAQTEEDLKRWADANVGWQYVLTVDGLKSLTDKGLIREKYKPTMFKYMNYYLWDRFMVNMIAQELKGEPWPDKGWENILAMADMIDDLDMAKRIRSSVYSTISEIEQLRSHNTQSERIRKNLVQVANTVNSPVMQISAFL